MQVTINRQKSTDVQTQGELTVIGKVGTIETSFLDDETPVIGTVDTIKFTCKTIEPPWKDNQKFVSCIPIGVYKAMKHKSPTHGDCFWINEVPGRTEILIHSGNFYGDSTGCILVGRSFLDINGDGNVDVFKSFPTLQQLLKILPDRFDLVIK